MLTAMRLVHRLQVLTGLVGGDQTAQLVSLIDGNTYGAEIACYTTKGRAAVGHLVLATGSLGEVVDVTISNYGYESYLIRYVHDPPLPEISEDWHIAPHVHFLLDPEKLADKMVEADGLNKEERELIDALPPKDRREAISEAVKDLWKLGHREFFYGLVSAEEEQRAPNDEMASKNMRLANNVSHDAYLCCIGVSFEKSL